MGILSIVTGFFTFGAEQRQIAAKKSQALAEQDLRAQERGRVLDMQATQSRGSGLGGQGIDAEINYRQNVVSAQNSAEIHKIHVEADRAKNASALNFFTNFATNVAEIVYKPDSKPILEGLSGSKGEFPLIKPPARRPAGLGGSSVRTVSQSSHHSSLTGQQITNILNPKKSLGLLDKTLLKFSGFGS